MIAFLIAYVVLALVFLWSLCRVSARSDAWAEAQRWARP